MENHKEKAECLTIDELRFYANEYRNRLRKMSDKRMSDKNKQMSDNPKMSDKCQTIKQEDVRQNNESHSHSETKTEIKGGLDIW